MNIKILSFISLMATTQMAMAIDTFQVNDLIEFADGHTRFEGTEKYGFANLKKRPCSVMIFSHNGNVSISNSEHSNSFSPYHAAMAINEKSFKAVSSPRRMGSRGATKDKLSVTKTKMELKFTVKKRVYFGEGMSGTSKQSCTVQR